MHSIASSAQPDHTHPAAPAAAIYNRAAGDYNGGYGQGMILLTLYPKIVLHLLMGILQVEGRHIITPNIDEPRLYMVVVRPNYLSH